MTSNCRMPFGFWIKNCWKCFRGWVSNRDVIWVKLNGRKTIYICYVKCSWNPFDEKSDPFVKIKDIFYNITDDGKVCSTHPLTKGSVDGIWMYASRSQQVMMNLKGEADL